MVSSWLSTLMPQPSHFLSPPPTFHEKRRQSRKNKRTSFLPAKFVRQPASSMRVRNRKQNDVKSSHKNANKGMKSHRMLLLFPFRWLLRELASSPPTYPHSTSPKPEDTKKVGRCWLFLSPSLSPNITVIYDSENWTISEVVGDARLGKTSGYPLPTHPHTHTLSPR